MCVLMFSTAFVLTSSCKVPVILEVLLMKLEFSRQTCERILLPNFINVLQVEAELFNVDGRTDMTKLLVGFRNCANAPKNDS